MTPIEDMLKAHAASMQTQSSKNESLIKIKMLAARALSTMTIGDMQSALMEIERIANSAVMID